MAPLRIVARQEFRAGEVVPSCGIYSVRHSPQHRPVHEVVLLQGQTFPTCQLCDGVRFLQMQSANYLFDDPDFADRSEHST